MAKIQCISCGGMAELDNGSSGECPYCGNTVTLRRYSAVKYVKAPERIKFQAKLKNEKPSCDNHMAQGMFYLQAKNYTLAYAQFEKAVEMNCECAESYYYKSLAAIGGRSPMELSMKEVRTISEDLNTAIALDEAFIYPQILLAILAIEYYEENGMTSPLDGEEFFEENDLSGIDEAEKELLQDAVITESDYLDN